MITQEQRLQIESLLLKQFDIDGEYEIDGQGLVSVQGTVNKANNMITRLPVRFDVVRDHFQMDRCALRSMVGFPRRVGGSVSVSRTGVASLADSPEFVGGNFWAYGCQLKNLVGAPLEVKGKFAVHDNDLKSYDHIPQGCKEIVLPYNPTLGVLRLLTYPKIEIISMGDNASRDRAFLLSHIVNHYAGTTNPGDILRCASELNEHGFEGNAEW
jgi:hypothetical protein